MCKYRYGLICLVLVLSQTLIFQKCTPETATLIGYLGLHKSRSGCEFLVASGRQQNDEYVLNEGSLQQVDFQNCSVLRPPKMEVVLSLLPILLEAELQLDLRPETKKKGIIHPVFALQYLS